MVAVGKYKHKSIIVQAVKYDGYNYPEIVDWVEGRAHAWPQWVHNYGTVDIKTFDGFIRCEVGDYIIFNISDNKFYVMPSDIFEKFYQEV